MKLTSGIERFQSTVFPQMQREFEALTSGQAPETLFITCSDSRIDPNLITQTKPGDLFVIRNAGNMVPKPGSGELSVQATIQYAVDVLKVNQIVVCGHSHCGAVSGLLNLDSLETMPVIKDWVCHSSEVLQRISSRNDVNEAIRANVMLQLEHLMEHPCVAAAVNEGGLDLQGWVYHFERGHIEFLNQSAAVA